MSTAAVPDPVILAAAAALINDAMRTCPSRPVVIGICGAQGSGKTTLARALAADCTARGLAAAMLSIDDLYLGRAERQRLAREVHPLLATRGVPGTHDVALGVATLAALARGEPVALPRFDKAGDDRAAPRAPDRAPGDCAVLLFEGWCVGARAQPPETLAAPVNALERDEDPHGTWRKYANAALAGPYQALFGRIDRLLLLAAPGFEAVFDWRRQQEHDLRAGTGARPIPGAPGIMDDAALARFVRHYERLTRHILAEMPPRADCVVRLDRERRPATILSRGTAGARSGGDRA